MKEFAKLRGRDKKIDLAFDVYKSQILKYFGESIAVLSGVDTVVLSGCNTFILQGVIVEILKQAGFLGITIKDLPWDDASGVSAISLEDSKIKVLINKKTASEIVLEKTLEITGGLKLPSRN